MAESLSLRDQLEASYAELSTDETPADGASANQAPAAGAGETASAEPPAEAPKNIPADAGSAAEAAAERDAQGRFKAKEAEGATAQPPAETNTETAKPEGEGPQTEATRPPPSLPAAIKAKFGSLDPDVQSAFVALEGSVQQAKAEWGAKGQRLNRYDEIIGPHADRWRLAGLDEFSGVQSLIAAQSLLDRNPLDGILHIARSYNLTPAHIAQAFGLSQANGQSQGVEGQQAPTGAPDFQAALQQALNPVVQQVQTLQQQIAQERQASQAASIDSFAKQIAEFAGKPENLYWDNVQDDVVPIATRLAGNGPVTMDHVAKAYEAAIWSNPEIRPLVMKAQADAAANDERRKSEEARKAAEVAARTKAQSANRAAGSVTGSPAPGSAPPKPAYGSVREAALAAIQELSGT